MNPQRWHLEELLRQLADKRCPHGVGREHIGQRLSVQRMVRDDQRRPVERTLQFVYRSCRRRGARPFHHFVRKAITAHTKPPPDAKIVGNFNTKSAANLTAGGSLLKCFSGSGLKTTRRSGLSILDMLRTQLERARLQNRRNRR